MSYEELGLSQADQLEIRERAVLGALNDAIVEILPIADEAVSTEFKYRVREMKAQIMDECGVDENEARLILAERLLMERNRGE